MRHRGARAPPRHRAGPPEEGSVLTGARFVGAFARADAALEPPLPEIALLGRSNVGKSSLLNALAGARVARVSGTPGKTRTLNAFAVPGRPGYHLLDLPGYGFARASRGARQAFRRLLEHTLDRPRLAGVVWLLDVRHAPSADDLAFRERFAARGVPVLAAATKGDKLPESRRAARARELAAALGLDADQLVVTSTRSGEGVAELREAIEHLAGAAA